MSQQKVTITVDCGKMAICRRVGVGGKGKCGRLLKAGHTAECPEPSLMGFLEEVPEACPEVR